MARLTSQRQYSKLYVAATRYLDETFTGTFSVVTLHGVLVFYDVNNLFIVPHNLVYKAELI